MRKLLVAGMLVLGLAFAQETVLKIDVEIVNVLFSVRDKKGALIPGLEKDAFTVLEDGKQQDIKYFTRETDLPLTIGLLVDVSRSQERLIEEERVAASEFFSNVLRPKDMAFLISFGSEAELLQDSTSSARLLKAGLEGLRVNSSVGGFHPGPVPTASKPRGTILFDATYLAADEKLKREVGRKIIVLITDGVDQGSRYTREEALRAAHLSDAVIYSIYFVDHEAYGGFGFGGDGDLKKLSEETGGRVFHVGRKNTLKSVFTQIQDEMRSQYSIGYTPNETGKKGEYRKIEIRPANKEYRAQARKGYFNVRGE